MRCRRVAATTTARAVRARPATALLIAAVLATAMLAVAAPSAANAGPPAPLLVTGDAAAGHRDGLAGAADARPHQLAMCERIGSEVAVAAARPPATACGGRSAATPTAGKHARLSPRLARLAVAAGATGRPMSAPDASEAAGLPARGPASLLHDAAGRPLVYARVTDAGPALLDRLRQAGAAITYVADGGRRLTLGVAAGDLGPVAAVEGVMAVSEALAPVVAGVGRPVAGTAPAAPSAVVCGSAISEGDAHLRADLAREMFGVDGTGVTVGVLSDSYDRAVGATDAAQDVASGDLPGPGNPCGRALPVQVRAEFPGPAEDVVDEGRAMLQIVHDLAPGATLAFATAALGKDAYAGAIADLVATGADVLVDDVTYLDEPFFQDGAVAQAVTAARDAGAVYVSAAGNQHAPGSGYETPSFRTAPCPVTSPALGPNIGCHDFDGSGGTDTTYRFTVPAGQSVVVDLQWAEPLDGVVTDLDAYLLRGSTGVTASLDDNVANGAPVELLSYENTSGTDEELQLVVARSPGGAEPRFKMVVFHSGAQTAAPEHTSVTGGDTVGHEIFGHGGTDAAITVAATAFFDGARVEEFSSRGPVTLRFGPATGGAPAPALAAPLVLAKPDLVASDGVRTTFLSGAPPRFFGTSAAAPHVAAVAALLRQRDPVAGPAAVRSALVATARPMLDGPEAAGAGRIDAVDALAAFGSQQVQRLGADDRVATAVAIARDSFPDGGAEAVVLARSDSFADALVGTPLAVARQGPLLLTGPAELDGRARAEILRVLDSGGTVYLLGGPTALAPAVAAELSATGYPVLRLGGDDRFATAVVVADQGLDNPGTVLEVTGRNFPDAVTAGAAAAADGDAAVLLTDGAVQAAATASYLAAHPGVARTAVGGPAALADPGAAPLVGADRYQTAALVAATFFASPEVVGVATGTEFPDALAGGAHIAAKGGPLLLSDPAGLPEPTSAYLGSQPGVGLAWLYGGVAALRPAVADQVAGAIVAGAG
ncbi:MAG: cell wall-binding repeat-containing protein [Acidimicrobiia bacterium]